ncbi:MAG: hypothetical protein H0X30_26400 [Anaerolineae bacterium]|nr:hypothetical protein [Anaerolineae bacterium]
MNLKILQQVVEMNIPVNLRVHLYDIIVNGKRHEAIRRAFHITHLKLGGRVENNQGKDIGGAWIDYAWSAEICGWLPHGSIIIGVVKYRSYLDRTNVMHGILLIPKDLHDYESFVGSEPLRSVELPSLNDPVKNAILDLNLFEAKSPIAPGNDSEVAIVELTIHNHNGRRQIKYLGQKFEDPTWIALAKVMTEMLEQLRQLYNDPEIDNYLSAGVQPEFE